jgi:hypothetical protein
MLYVLGVAGVILGALFGLVFRLLLFVLILLLAVAVLIVVMIASGQDGVLLLLHAVIAVIALQIGYVLGIATRAVMRRNATRLDATPQDQSHFLQPIGRPKR